MPDVLFKRHEQLSAGDWRRLLDLAQEFEAAWRQSFGPDINQFIPAAASPRQRRHGDGL